MNYICNAGRLHMCAIFTMSNRRQLSFVCLKALLLFKFHFGRFLCVFSDRIKMETCVRFGLFKGFCVAAASLLCLNRYQSPSTSMLFFPSIASCSFVSLYKCHAINLDVCVLFPLTQSFFGQIVLVFFSFLPSGRY